MPFGAKLDRAGMDDTETARRVIDLRADINSHHIYNR